MYQSTGQDRLEALWWTFIWDTDRNAQSRATASTGESLLPLACDSFHHSVRSTLGWWGEGFVERAVAELD
jgi:hypothetical protein